MSGTGTCGHPYREPSTQTSQPETVEVDSNDVEATTHYQDLQDPGCHKDDRIATAVRMFKGNSATAEKWSDTIHKGSSKGTYQFDDWLKHSQSMGLYQVNNTTYIPANLICRIERKVIPTKLLAEVKKQR